MAHFSLYLLKVSALEQQLLIAQQQAISTERITSSSAQAMEKEVQRLEGVVQENSDRLHAESASVQLLQAQLHEQMQLTKRAEEATCEAERASEQASKDAEWQREQLLHASQQQLQNVEEQCSQREAVVEEQVRCVEDRIGGHASFLG